MKTTVQLSLRDAIQGMAALGMSATAGRVAWAAETRGGSGLPGRHAPYLAYAVESGGKAFLNPALLARRGDELRVRMVN